MKVVLLKDVPGVGRKNEVKNVADGYAINFLIPRKLAEMGTRAALASAERTQKEAAEGQKIQAGLLSKNLQSLEGVRIEMEEKANEKGHLFSGIHKETIVAELKKQKGIELLPEFLVLAHPIKEAGEHKIEILAQGKTASVILIVKPYFRQLNVLRAS